MRSTTQVSIQASEKLVPAAPPWFGEVVVIAFYLGKLSLAEHFHPAFPVKQIAGNGA
ncbi:MAG TPA: hypothetical protein VKT82_30185 [Ktedonobacterales bacterium]|nr:hypothetical protein [Ktedonobacterales bacterium]